MPRGPRNLSDGAFYHILNRGNAKQKVFHDTQDYTFFLQSVVRAKDKHPVDIFAYCLMPNHFHFVVRADIATDISKLIHIFMTRFNQRYRRVYNSIGHIWQGRYKDFMIQNEDHLMVVIRYIERNPVQAGLVVSASNWRWSSHNERITGGKLIIHDNYIFPLNGKWTEYVNSSISEKEKQKMERSIIHQTPFGDEDWVKKTCEQYGLEHTRRLPGRPRKKRKIINGDSPL